MLWEMAVAEAVDTMAPTRSMILPNFMVTKYENPNEPERYKIKDKRYSERRYIWTYLHAARHQGHVNLATKIQSKKPHEWGVSEAFKCGTKFIKFLACFCQSSSQVIINTRWKGPSRTKKRGSDPGTSYRYEVLVYNIITITTFTSAFTSTSVLTILTINLSAPLSYHSLVD